VPALDLIDETFVSAAPAAVAKAVHEQARWSRWWPDLGLEVFMDRGDKGIRWSATGPYVGSLELWLEPVGDGVLVHHYVRLDPTAPGSTTEPLPEPSDPAGWRRAARDRARYARRWKQQVWALKDHLEGARRPGERASPAGSTPAV
jgi:hypothetical protein